MEPNDGNKQYSLRWEKHAFNLATEAGCFFEDESFLDCTLSAEGQCIDAHKIILSASSSYLSSLLKLMPDKHPILIFNDMKFEQLKSLVAFIYNGSVNISENDIHAFLNAAQSLLIKGLYEEEPKDPTKTSEQIKKNRRDVDVYDVRKNNHKLHERVPPLRKSEMVQDFTKAARKERMPKGCGPMNNDCEDSLFKLQEISFTKYIQQHLNLKNTNRCGDDKLNELPDDKLKGPENYVVKSWKHNSVDDLNGRQKQSKSNFLKKLKLEKSIFAGVEKISQPEKGRPFTEHEPEGKRDEKETIESGAGEKVKKEEDNEAKYLIEPKKEIIEEEDINCDNFDKSLEICSSESDSGFETRPVSNYFHHPAVETGIPVPLLMCKTSLNEPDSIDSNWMPPVNSSVSSNHSLHHIQNENAQDLQCRTCTQDLPCPTCTKKYKSRYALNRHILYECGKARKSFSCDECGKKVTRQDTLQKHKLIHLVQHLKDKESESELLEPTKAKKKC